MKAGEVLLLAFAITVLAWYAPEQRSCSAADTGDSMPVVTVDSGNEEPVSVRPGEEEEEGDRIVSRVTEVFAGYRFLSVDGVGGNASTYEYLHPSLTGGLFHSRLGKDLKYSLDGDYRSRKDYYGDFLFDYSGTYKLHLRAESLFHNLPHVPLSPSFTLGPSSYSLLDADTSGRYGIQAEQDLAQFRYKLRDFPLHLNLAYWRLEREGNRQIRYADHSFESTGNFINSGSRPVHGVTDEATIGLDGHFGFLDLVYTFTARQFEDKAGVPRDIFVNSSAVPTALQHNENPDSRYIAHTIKIHTSLDGGITGGGSYTYGRRENRSKLTDVIGADQTAATLQNIAGDFVYTPSASVSVAFKYRRQEVDTDSPSTIVTPFATVEPVRQAFTTIRDLLTATVSYHPFTLWTVKGEYSGEFNHRHYASSGAVQNLNWHGLPEDSNTHRGTVSLLGRPIRGLRLKADYTYAHTDNPSYGLSPENRHDGKALVTYSESKMWGLTASYRALRDSNDSIVRQQITLQPADPVNPLAYSPYPNPQARERKIDNLTASIWVAPVTSVTLSGSYGLLQSRVEQGILFTVVTPSVVQDVASYRNQAQFYALNGSYHMSAKTTLSLILQQVRSSAEFRPQTLGPATDGITDISRLKTVENSLGARGDYRFSERISGSVDYALRDYDNKSNTTSGGTVHVVSASLAARW